MTYAGGIVEYVSEAERLTVTAGAAVTGGNVVKLSANRTVIITAATAEAKVLGAALYTVASGDANLTVATDGVWPLVASGAISAGDDVTGAAAGQVITLAPAAAATLADINNARNVIGMALEAISNAAPGRIKLRR